MAADTPVKENTARKPTPKPIEPDDGLPQNICRGCSKTLKTAIRFRSQSQTTEKKLLQLFKCTLRTSDVGSGSNKDLTDEKIMLKAVGDVSEEKPLLKAFENVPEEKPMLKDFANDTEEKPMLKAFEYVPEETKILKTFENVPEEKPMLKAFDDVPDEKPILIGVGNTEEYEVKIEFEKLEWNTDVESGVDNDLTDLRARPVPLESENLSSGDELLCHMQSFSKAVVIKEKKAKSQKKNRKPETYDRKRCLELVEGPLDMTQPIQCKICKKYSKSINTFENHSLSHLGYNILCEFCAKPCMTTTDLLRHQRAKHGLAKGNSLPCSFCGFQAIYREQLEVHERRVHTKERPFTCDDCGDSFFTKRVLIQHRALRHKSDKPYKCDLCPSKFKLRSRLTRHMNRVHNKKDTKYSYSCHICSNRYSSSGETRNHLVKIHGVPLEQQGKIQRFHNQLQEEK